MSIGQGDFVLLNYTLKIKEEDKVIDTTLRELGEKYKIEKERFEPILVIVGEGVVPKGLEEGIVGLEEGSEKTVEVPPDKGFGRRDPNLVRVYSARFFANRGVIPRVNMEVEIDGRRGVILSVGGGRVIVDLNHPLAGKTLIYKVKIVKIIKSLEDKVKALLRRKLYLKEEEVKDIKVIENGKVLEITFPLTILGTDELYKRVSTFIEDIGKHIPSVETVRFRIEHVFEKPKVKEEGVKREAQPQRAEGSGS